jgi:DICT domain-containing protein
LSEQFVGKKIKVLMYSEDEVFPVVEEKPISKAAQFRGMFTKQEAQQFHNYVNESRNEWERDI